MDMVLNIGAADIMLLNIAATFAGKGFRLSRTHFQCPHAHQATWIKLGHLHNISLSAVHGSEGKW